MRQKYILSANEVEALVAGLIHNGPQNMYNLMKEKTTANIVVMEEMDLMLMDMCEDVLQLGRDMESEENEENKQIRSLYYVLASMLRRLAHEVQIAYIRSGKERNDIRFLRVVSDNKDSMPMFKPEG